MKISLIEFIFVTGLSYVFGEPLKCEKEGLFPHESDCRTFVDCWKYKDTIIRSVKQCPPSTLFSIKSSICDHENKVDKSKCDDLNTNMNEIIVDEQPDNEIDQKSEDELEDDNTESKDEDDDDIESKDEDDDDTESNDEDDDDIESNYEDYEDNEISDEDLDE